MKIVTLIARILLGFVFLVAGFTKFLHLSSAQLPPGAAGQFMEILFTTHYIWIIGAIEVVTGVLFLINRYVPLALTLVGPVIINIFLVGALMVPSSLPIALLVVILWLIVFASVRQAFAGIFLQRV